MAWQGTGVGIDFRSTSGFVTDPSYATWEILPGGGGSYSYPTVKATADGVSLTYGWENVGGSSGINVRDRNSGLDPRLAGVNFGTNSAPNTFRIDLPAPGQYQIGLALGDPAGGNAFNNVCQINDTNTLLADVSKATTSTTWADAMGNLWTSAQWPGSNVLRSVTFTTSICRIVIGATGAGNTGIATLRLIQLASGVSQLACLGAG